MVLEEEDSYENSYWIFDYKIFIFREVAQMSVKWYEQHLEKIVKQNEQLRYKTSKKNDFQHIAQKTRAIFSFIFTDIPPMDIKNDSIEALDEMFGYYKKSAGIWVQMMKKKVELLEQKSDLSRKIVNDNYESQIKYVIKDRKDELCLVCGQPKDKTVYDRLSIRIHKLEGIAEELNMQIDELEQHEQKYLKQISYLRSITKKLEYQLIQERKVWEKKDKNGMREVRDLEEEICQLQREVHLWKKQYEIIYDKKVKNNYDEFEEQRNLLNHEYKGDHTLQMMKTGSMDEPLPQYSKTTTIVASSESSQRYE